MASISPLSRNQLQVLRWLYLDVTFPTETTFIIEPYTITVSVDGGVESLIPYVFRAALPMEPFYETAVKVLPRATSLALAVPHWDRYRDEGSGDEVRATAPRLVFF